MLKFCLIAVSSIFILAGCYTQVYPPPQQNAGNVVQDGTVAEESNVVKGININIYNQDENYPLDRYYMVPWNYRSYRWHDRNWWDPYYYDYGQYYRRPRWSHDRYHPGGGSAPKPKKPRRDENYRRDQERPDDEDHSDSSTSSQSIIHNIFLKSGDGEKSQQASSEESPKSDANEKQTLTNPETEKTIEAKEPEPKSDPPVRNVRRAVPKEEAPKVEKQKEKEDESKKSRRKKSNRER